MIRRGKRRNLALNEPLKHPDHKRPVTRRDFLAQGFMTGAATVVAPTLMGLFARNSYALSPDLEALKVPAECDIQAGAGKVPFICFDLAGGANIAGSNVLVGKEGGQRDFLTTAGYSKLGLPGDMTPASSTTNFIEDRMGLLFHTDSAFLRGMLTTMQVATMANIDGVVIPARSENDTSNNPHNPMYGIAKTGSRGELLTLIGSQSSDSGGNSMAPAMMIDPTVRPTKVDRTSDATGLIDTGELGTLLPQNDTVAVMESIARVSWNKLGRVSTGLVTDADAKKLVRCGYVKTAYLAEAFGNPSETDPSQDPFIQAIFAGVGGMNSDREFEKTAAVMKLVVNGYAGAGTVSMGGFDYHTGERATGEMRDFRAGQCMGACLEYAARIQQPLMLYVFSDGSLSSNGMIDGSVGGRGKGVWTGDNQQTAASFFLVYNPGARPSLLIPGRQIGYFRPSGDVETGGSVAANNVNLLVETVLLNYMALNGEQGQFRNVFPTSSISNAMITSLMAFNPL